MSTQSSLGCCPNCETEISRGQVLIEYERTDGPAMYAECPTCRGVVHPE